MVGKIAFLFPGQGSQFIGMGKVAYGASPNAKKLVDQADEILGYSLSQWMFEGPEEKLRETTVTQPALFVSSGAALELMKERGIKPDWVAGHSLGEYSALYAAGVVGFDEALKLVAERGKAMQQAAESTAGSMAAVIGLAGDVLSDICNQASTSSEVCVPANFNSETQIVISGSKPALKRAMELAQAKGAAKVVELNVSGAFHSPLMKSAVQLMQGKIMAAHFQLATFPVITNVDAEPTTAASDFKRKLVEQIDHPVRWHSTLQKLIGLGAETFVEIGAGKVLSSMVKRLDRKKRIFCTDEFDAIEKAAAMLTA